VTWSIPSPSGTATDTPTSAVRKPIVLDQAVIAVSAQIPPTEVVTADDDRVVLDHQDLERQGSVPVRGRGHHAVELGLNGGDLDVASLADQGYDPGDEGVEAARLEAPGQEMVRSSGPTVERSPTETDPVPGGTRTCTTWPQPASSHGTRRLEASLQAASAT
jgi:hypothetical protein